MSHTGCHKCDVSFIKLYTLPVASTDKLNGSVVVSFAYFCDYVVVSKVVSASASSMEGVGFKYHLGECPHFMEVNSEMLPVGDQFS